MTYIMEAGLKAAKSALRKEISAKLKQLTEHDIEQQTKNVMEKLLKDPAIIASKRISVYLTMEHEIETMPLINFIFENNKECYIPKYRVGGKIMDMVQLYSLEDFHNLPVTKWKIKQPAANDKRPDALETGGLDVIVAPGVAFTTDGKRLGHGRGYYDSYFHRCQAASCKPYVIGLALKEQIVPDLPMTESDVMINKVYFG